MKKAVWKRFGKKAAAVLAGTLLAAGLTACGGTGGTAAAGDVTETEAASIAMEHAGVKEDDALSLRVSQEEEDGVAVYDVEFATADRRYHCDVVRSSGEVLNFSYNAVTSGDDQADDGAAAQTSGTQESSASAAQTDDASASSAQQSTASSGAIDEAQARSIALEHAGVAESDAKFYRVERDSDDGREARDETRRYLGCDLLILDDLGSELTTQFTQSALYELINGRLVGGKRTVISSNLSMEEAAVRYSPQIASRLEGEYHLLHFFGEDIRLLRKKQL